MKIFDLNTIQNIALSQSSGALGRQVISILHYDHPYKRANPLGHITASGLVIHENKVLMIFHPYIKLWFQPGGHIDEGESPVDAAIREVYEETGFVCGSDSEFSELIDIDVHEIPANPNKGEGPHLHIDLLYRLKVLRQEKSPEGISYKWFSFDEVESTRIQRALTNLA
jgi:8-oxo-dGTP pyrophosphatase MutT (NUDIX family)